MESDSRHSSEQAPPRFRHLTLAIAIATSVAFAAAAASYRHQAKEAEREGDRAREVTQFLVDQFQLAASNPGHTETATARDVLDSGTRKIEEDSFGLPEDRAAALGALGGAYIGLGLHEEAERLLQWSLSLRRESARGRDSDLVINLLDLAFVHRIRGSCTDAAALQSEAVELVVAEDVGDLRLAQFLNNRAFALNNRMGHPDLAEVRYRLALTIKLRWLGEGDPAVARGRHNLAVALELQGEYEEAAQHLERALDLRQSLHGASSMEVARTLNALVALLQHTDDLSRAESYARKNLEIRLAKRSAGDPDVAKAQNTLAVILRLRGRPEAAEALLRQAFDSLNDRFGEEHRGVATVLSNLASVLAAEGRPVAAEASARRALDIFRRVLPPDHWRIAEAESVLAGCLLELDRLAEAESLLARAYPRLRTDLGEGSRYAREARERLAELSRALGETDAEERVRWLTLVGHGGSSARRCP